MGRVPTINLNLPPHMRARKQRSGKIFYYLDTGKRPRHEIPLGSDYALAVKRWAELEIDKTAPPDLITFRYAAERYMREVIPHKAIATQRDNLRELANLYKFFDTPPAPLDQIEAQHIRQYLDWRKDAPVRGTREKALFSHIWNMARAWGYTNKPNPCEGIKGVSSKRDVYIEDEVYDAVYAAADEPLRDALTLAYLTGQRPADTLRMRENDLRDGMLHVRQGKTSEKLRMAVIGELAGAIARIMERKKTHKVRSLALICNEEGQPLTTGALRYRFEAAREKAAQCDYGNYRSDHLAKAIRQFQFRDLRAKAGTDKAESTDMRKAQKQLGHKSIATTEIYLRNRRGEKVEPTK